MIEIHEFFNHWLEPTFLFWWEKKGAQLFLIWVIFWKFIWKLSWVLHGKIVVSLENDFWLLNLPRQLKTHISFSMFPILDTNLWVAGNNVLPNFHSLMLFAKDNGNDTQNEGPKIDQVLLPEWCQSGMLTLVVGF